MVKKKEIIQQRPMSQGRYVELHIELLQKILTSLNRIETELKRKV